MFENRCNLISQLWDDHHPILIDKDKRDFEMKEMSRLVYLLAM